MKGFIKEKLKTLYFFYQYLGTKMYAMFAFSCLMVLMDSLGLTLFIPLLQITDGSYSADAAGETGGEIILLVQQTFQFLHLKVNISNMLILIILLFTLKGVFYYFATKYNVLAQNMMSLKLRTRLGLGIRDLTYKEFVHTDVGRLQNSLLAEVWQVIGACTQYLEFLKNIVFVLIYLSFAFLMDWRFTLLVAIGGGVTNWIYKYFYRRTQELSRKITKNNHRYGGSVVELVNHFKYLKATGRNQLFFNRMDEELHDLVRNNIAVGKLGAKLAAIREPMTIVVICAVIALHVLVFKSPLSAVIIILLFFYRVMQKIIDIQNNWNNYLAATGSLENIQDYQRYLDTHKEEFYTGRAELKSISAIQLKDVRLAYGDFQVLKGITLDIQRNQTVAFVGESGSGKTTLVNVISGLLPFDQGRFEINGQSALLFDIQQYKSKIGYISQEPTIFNASVFDNVTFWDKPTVSNIKKFQDVIAMCSLSKFIGELSSGQDTLLGNNGVNISGGQKQRISIARELYRDVELLIMDEATSALDSETEREIKDSIESLQGKVTIVSIAHRLSTIQSADRIYLMNAGKITAEGSFGELKLKSDYFRKMTELQGM